MWAVAHIKVLNKHPPDWKNLAGFDDRLPEFGRLYEE
jgi:hypothetical protein